MSSKAKALVVLLIASFFWSTSGYAAKTLLKFFDPISLAAIRLSIAALVILPLFLRVTKRINKNMVCDVLPVSLFSAGNFIFFLFGIQRTTANAAAIIYTTASLTTYIQPVFAFLFNGILLGEIITPGFFAGSLLVFAGVFVATGGKIFSKTKKLFSAPRQT